MSDDPECLRGGCAGPFIPSIALSPLPVLVSGAEIPEEIGELGDVFGRDGKSHGRGTYDWTDLQEGGTS